MQSEQKYFSRSKQSFNINPQFILSKIESENARFKMLVNSCRDRSFREDDVLGNDSDLSKNDLLSQNRNFYKQNSRNRLKRHSLFQNERPVQSKQYFGDQLLHQKKTKNNFFKHNQQLNKFYQKLNPINKNNHQQMHNFHNPQLQHRFQSQLQGIKSHRQVDSKKKISIFRVKSKIDEHALKNTGSSKSQPKPKKKVQFREHQNVEIETIDANILALHINTLDFLQAYSTPQKIFAFFQSIYQALRLKKIYEPVIKRYKNCIYYGQKVVEQNTLYQGMIWYFKQTFYFGELSENRKHGKGIQIRFQKGEPCIWKGKFINGHKNGYFQVWTNEYRYYGKLKDGLFEGEGYLITPASQYKGTFVQGLKQGKGWQKFTNKTQYKGQYFNNKYDGQGQLKAPNYYYKGLFKKGRPDGYGFQRTSEFQYLGTFVMGKKQGKGRLKTSDGIYVQCEFKNGLIVEQKERQIQSPKQIVLDHYMSKQLHALNQENEEGTLENMLNAINNSNLRRFPLEQQ